MGGVKEEEGKLKSTNVKLSAFCVFSLPLPHGDWTAE